MFSIHPNLEEWSLTILAIFLFTETTDFTNLLLASSSVYSACCFFNVFKRHFRISCLASCSKSAESISSVSPEVSEVVGGNITSFSVRVIRYKLDHDFIPTFRSVRRSASSFSFISETSANNRLSSRYR